MKTSLTWRKTTPRSLRRVVTKAAQAVYPSATDTGDALLIEHGPKDAGVIHLFLAGAGGDVRAFSGLRKGES